MNFIYVFIGGGLGAVSRYFIALIMGKGSDGFPYATFIANVFACLILGYLMGLATQKNIDSKYSLFLMTGFCGGFSTFSTFSAENFKLIENGNYSLAFLYVFLSLLICLVAIFLGLKLQSFT